MEMNDLVAFVRACLDEDERVARAVEDRSEPWVGVWRADGSNALRTYNGWVLTYGRPDAPLAPGFVDHVAFWDPARVLAEIEAKRRILDELQAATEYLTRMWDSAGFDDPGSLDLQERVVRLLALPYADRDGYLEAWRP